MYWNDFSTIAMVDLAASAVFINIVIRGFIDLVNYYRKRR